MVTVTAAELLTAYAGGAKPAYLNSDALQTAADVANAAAKPRVLNMVFDVEYRNDGVAVLGTTLVLRGKDLAKHLDGCKKVALIVATLGLKFDTAVSANLGEVQYLVDLAGLILVEKALDDCEAKLQTEYPDCKFEPRFSAGYGDLPLSQQGEILRVLDASRRLGVVLTTGDMMIPSKSVTAVLGIHTH